MVLARMLGCTSSTAHMSITVARTSDSGLSFLWDIQHAVSYVSIFRVHVLRFTDGKSLDNDSLAVIGENNALDSKSEIPNGSTVLGGPDGQVANAGDNAATPPVQALKQVC